MTRTNIRQRAGGRQYSRYLVNYARKNNMILVLGALFLAGVFFGTLLVRSAGSETLDLLLRLVGGFVDHRQDQQFLQSFFSSLSGSLIYVALVFVCGFCAIGQPVELLALLFRGLGFGFSAASLYSVYGSRAVGFVCALMVPGMLISTVAILFCCRESVRLSGAVMALLRGEHAREPYPIRVYCARFIAAVLLCCVAALAETVLHALFGGFFLPL